MPVSADYLVRLFGLEGEVAFITGGAGAIGAATARAYAGAGATVVVADKAQGAAERVADDVKAMGGRVLAVGMDVTQERSVQVAVEEASRQFGKVDILVNNAGINIRKPPQELTPADWQAVMDVNVTGYFLCARAVGPGMLARKAGRIINVASIMGFRGSSITTNLAYNTSKGAVGTSRARSRVSGRPTVSASTASRPPICSPRSPRRFSPTRPSTRKSWPALPWARWVRPRIWSGRCCISVLTPPAS